MHILFNCYFIFYILAIIFLLCKFDIVYEYDLNGNTVRMVSPEKSALYVYNAENRLIRATVQSGNDVSVEEYEYDYAGNRVAKSTEGEYIKYLLDTNSELTYVLAEMNYDGTERCFYTRGNMEFLGGRIMSIFLSSEAHVSASVIICHNIRIIKTKIKTINVGDYTDVIDDIGIIINCFPVDEINLGLGKRREYISYKKRFADIRLPLDFDELITANREKQYYLIINNIIESLKVIKNKIDKKKGKFDFDQMVQDILCNLEVNQSEISC